MLLIIDNYDSFTFNLVQTFGEIAPGLEIQVHRNDAVSVQQIEELQPTHLVISPGPCTPREGGVSNEVIRAFAGRLPLLGVCLGHQCIGYVSGARIVRAKRLVHGKTSRIQHVGRGLFAGLSNPFEATRYHSLVIEPGTLPPEYEVVAWCADDAEEIMGVQHRTLPVFGVQFHPESFLSVEGPKLLANFLSIR